MHAVVWIAEGTWEACVDQAAPLLPADADITLLHVAPSDVEDFAARGGARLLGRHPPPPPSASLRAVAEEEAEALLADASSRLARRARMDSRCGSVEREVVAACVGADLLICARGGQLRLGPDSVSKRTRFVVDHAPCAVLLVWAGPPPGTETIPLPPPAPPKRVT